LHKISGKGPLVSPQKESNGMDPITPTEELSESGPPPQVLPAGERVRANAEGPLAEATEPAGPKMAPQQLLLVILGTVAFLYFARPVLLPLFLAWMAATTLRPLMRVLSYCRLPTPISAAFVFCLLVTAIIVGFVQVGRPASKWMDDAPQHVTELRQRIQRLFPKAIKLSHATAAVSDLGATAEEKKQAQKDAPVVEVKDQRGTTSILNWTGTFLAGLGEVLVLIYLLLASGDLFLQKIVRVTPTLSGKKRAVEISHEIQQSISSYMFSVSMINACVGFVVSLGLYFMKVPNPALWGVLVAILNFVPYFGPVVGIFLLAAVGLLTFDSPSQEIMPPLWFLLIHLLESNFVTPILLGRRLTLNPVAIFVSLIFWIWLWGIPGGLLSVPILVSIKVVCDRIPSISYFGELIGD
jgi:predicted PurR-regulated permease PerM